MIEWLNLYTIHDESSFPRSTFNFHQTKLHTQRHLFMHRKCAHVELQPSITHRSQRRDRFTPRLISLEESFGFGMLTIRCRQA